MVIDSHQHFWIYDPVEYDWIDNDMKRIRADFLPSALKEVITLTGVDGVITIQARQSIEETDWILQHASGNDFIKGVIGWLPLIDKHVEDYL